MPGHVRALIVGLDGADADVVARWMDSGLLPTLARLRSAGTSARIASPPGLGDDAAWASFATGLGPGEHGRFHHRVIRPGAHEPAWFRRDQMDCPPFWEALDRAGKQVAVIDVPKAPLGRLRRGCSLADWMPHGPETASVVATPKWLEELVTAEFAPPPGFVCDRLDRTAEQYAGYVDELLARLELRGSLTRRVLAEADWDLLLTVVAETHCVGHQCWHLHDESHPGHDGAMRAAIGDPLERVYAAADRHLAALLEAAKPSTVVVFSPLGMAPNHSGNHLLPEVLARLDAPAGRRRRMGRETLSNVRAAPRRIRRLAPPVGRFFAVDHDLPTGAVRINLAGREPAGSVEPGGEYEAVLDDLQTELAALRRADTGEPAVLSAATATDRYPGRFSNAWADLVVDWDRRGPLTAVRSPRIGTVRAEPPHDRSGNHVDRGWFIAAGPDLAHQQIAPAVPVVELTATIAGLCGVEFESPCTGLSFAPGGRSTRASISDAQSGTGD
jgi:predicted AlkP superfamily phosphohydrolase/phosphomutase